jgi:thiamine-phosphate pyrophosphorylase
LSAEAPRLGANEARAAPPRTRLGDARLYLCTPDRDDLVAFVASCIRGGVDVVQLREKSLDARPLLARARLLKQVCADGGVPFVLNDRPDLALESGADGVHVGQDDAPAALARRILGPDAIVGLSTHRIEELEPALDEPVDYISAGPVVATPTKPGRRGTGLAYVGEAEVRCGSRAMPFFVTGGVSPETVPTLVAAGARRFVVVRYLTQAPDPEQAARRLRGVIDEERARIG